eukprot:m.38020 g.38020  ORF g.38020 m.38020 type:complete len:264 (+) comp6772_c0_seq3:1412-2203(+)
MEIGSGCQSIWKNLSLVQPWENLNLSCGMSPSPSENPLRHIRSTHSETLLRTWFLLHLFSPWMRILSLLDHSCFKRALKTFLGKGGVNSKVAFVVPAFELVVGDRATLSVSDFPLDKFSLLQSIEAGNIIPFRQDASPKSHFATNYEKWAKASTPYSIHYMDMFEPYVIVPKNGMPRFDESFVGYGMNKISFAMELYAGGFEFVVVPDAWVIHLPHIPSKSSKEFSDDASLWLKTRMLRFSFLASLHGKYNLAIDGHKLSSTP